MKVVIACESSSLGLKEAIRSHLVMCGHEVDDVGQMPGGPDVLYYQAGAALAEAMRSGLYERGIAICGTGAGISLVLNKYSGVYCVACESVFTAEKIAHINNANVLAMGSRMIGNSMGTEMAEKFLAAKWCEGFTEQRRLNNEKGYEVLQSIERDERR